MLSSRVGVTADNEKQSLSRSSAEAGPLLAAPAELQLLRSPHVDVNLSQIATTLWYRYHVHPNWIEIILDTVVSSLTPVNFVLSCRLLQEISERTLTGLEEHLRDWLSKKPLSVVHNMFTDLHVAFFAELVASNVMPTKALIATVIRPAWLACAKASFESHDNRRALRNIVTLFEKVAFRRSEEALPTITSLRQRLESEQRRWSLLTPSAVASYAESLALLSIVQELADGNDARRFETLFVRVSEDPCCMASITRYTDPFCAAFLGLSVSSSSAFHSLHSKVLAALVFLLKDGKDCSFSSL